MQLVISGSHSSLLNTSLSRPRKSSQRKVQCMVRVGCWRCGGFTQREEVIKRFMFNCPFSWTGNLSIILVSEDILQRCVFFIKFYVLQLANITSFRITIICWMVSYLFEYFCKKFTEQRTVVSGQNIGITKSKNCKCNYLKLHQIFSLHSLCRPCNPCLQNSSLCWLCAWIIYFKPSSGVWIATVWFERLHAVKLSVHNKKHWSVA